MMFLESLIFKNNNKYGSVQACFLNKNKYGSLDSLAF